MCNAWNHDPNCQCGWGGEGHLGRRSSNDNSDDWRIPPIYTKYAETFVRPNAQCPVCKQLVFFYKSPTGGRVYFDELGPPWPKHACTIRSNKNPISISSYQSIRRITAAQYSWSQDGWEPFVDVHSRKYNSGYVVKGLHKNRTLELKFSSDALNYSVQQLDSCLWMAKALGGWYYELSLCSGFAEDNVRATLSSAPTIATGIGQSLSLQKKLAEVESEYVLEIGCSLCGNKEIKELRTLREKFHGWSTLQTIQNYIRPQKCPNCQSQGLDVKFVKK